MGTLDLRFDLKKFWISEENEGSNDEPYLIVLFILLDAHGIDFSNSPATWKTTIKWRGGQGNLGDQFDDVPDKGKSNAIKIPEKLGVYTPRIHVPYGAKDWSPLQADPLTFVSCIVYAMEEDATAAQHAKKGIPKLKNYVRAELDKRLADGDFYGDLPDGPFEKLRTKARNKARKAINAAAKEGWKYLTTNLEDFKKNIDGDDFVGYRVMPALSFTDLSRLPKGKRSISMKFHDSGEDEGTYHLSGELSRESWPHVAAVAKNKGYIDVFARGDNRQILWKQKTLRWSSWKQTLPYKHFSSGPAVASWASNRLDVFARGDDNYIYITSKRGSSDWSDWWSTGGLALGGPAVVARDTGRLDLFVIGNDQKLWHRSYKQPTWDSWTNKLGSAGFGKFRPSTPAVSSWEPDRLDVFALGLEGSVYHASRREGTWDPLHPVQKKYRFISGPAVATWGPEHMNVFALGNDRRIYTTSWDKVWEPWYAIGSGTFFSGPAAVSPGANRLEVYAIGDDRKLWRAKWSSTSGWSGWSDKIAHGQILT